MPRFNYPRKKKNKYGFVNNKYNTSHEERENNPPHTSNAKLRSEKFHHTTWNIRETPQNNSGKTYTCPGCHQKIYANTTHLVIWPQESILGEKFAINQRRHWHKGCWKHREYS